MSFWLILLILFVTLYVLNHIKKNSRYSHLPGPSPWLSLPLVGHAHLLAGDVDAGDILRGFHRRFGDIFRFDLGSAPTVYLCDYATVAEALKMEAFNGRTQLDDATAKAITKQGVHGEKKLLLSLLCSLTQP